MILEQLLKYGENLKNECILFGIGYYCISNYLPTQFIVIHLKMDTIKNATNQGSNCVTLSVLWISTDKYLCCNQVSFRSKFAFFCHITSSFIIPLPFIHLYLSSLFLPLLILFILFVCTSVQLIIICFSFGHHLLQHC